MAKKRKPHNGKPELSDGYVKIANELWQALIDYDFTAAQMKIIAVIIRETYGYNRKSKNLSVSYISKATHLSKVGTRKALDKLIAQKVVTEYCEPTPRASREIGLNKYYLDWGREISEYHSEGNQSRPLPEYHSEGNQSRPLPEYHSEGNQSIPLEGNRSITKPIQYKDTFKDNKPAAQNSYWDDMFAD